MTSPGSPPRQPAGPILWLIFALLALGSLPAPAASLTWNGASSGGTWDTTNTNWNTATAVPWDLTNGASNIALFDTAGLTLNVASVYANGITFTESATLSGGNITLSGTTPTISGDGNGTINSVLDGTAGFTKSGNGTLTLTSTNVYTGGTRITGGTVAITSDSNLGAAPGTATASSIVIDNGILSTSGTFTLSANRGIAVGPTSGSGNGTIDVASGELTYNGIIASNGASSTGSLTKTGSGTLTLGGNNTFTGSLTKTGSGTLTLGGNNTFTGGVTINAGTLQLANAGALNSSSPNSITFGASAPATTKLQLNGYSVTIGSLATNATPGTVAVENASASFATLTVDQSAGTTFAGALQDGTGGGALSLTKNGNGTLTLTGTNTHTGTTTVNAGTLALGGSAISDTGAVVLTNASGAALQLNASETIGSLAGGGATGGNVALGAFTLTSGGANSDTAYNGVISGAGSLVKTGT